MNVIKFDKATRHHGRLENRQLEFAHNVCIVRKPNISKAILDEEGEILYVPFYTKRSKLTEIIALI